MAKSSQSKFKICIVSSLLPSTKDLTGAAIVIVTLAKELAASGNDVTLLVPAYLTKVEIAFLKTKLFRGSAVSILSLPVLSRRNKPKSKFALINKTFEIAEFIANSSFDLVFFNDFLGDAYGTLKAKQNGKLPRFTKIVVLFHGPLQWLSRWNSNRPEHPIDSQQKRIETFCLRNADTVWCATRYSRTLATKMKVRAPKIFVRQFPVFTTQETQSLLHTSSRIGKRKLKNLAFIGRLEKRKGLLTFLSALLELKARQQLPRKIFLIGAYSGINHTSSKAYLDTWSRNHQIDLNVKYFSKRKNFLRFLSQTDRLNVYASLDETMNCALLEGLSIGAPLICSDIPAHRELASQNKTILFNAGDPEGLAAKIQATLNNKKRRTQKPKLKSNNWDQFTARLAQRNSLRSLNKITKSNKQNALITSLSAKMSIQLTNETARLTLRGELPAGPLIIRFLSNFYFKAHIPNESPIRHEAGTGAILLKTPYVGQEILLRFDSPIKNPQLHIRILQLEP